MARLFEFACFLFIVYLFYRRLAAPFRRGYDSRERERREMEAMKRQARDNATKTNDRSIDRSNLKDAEFKDL